MQSTYAPLSLLLADFLLWQELTSPLTPVKWLPFLAPMGLAKRACSAF
jgi:hypothetical protein